MKIDLIIPTLRRHDGISKVIRSFEGQYDSLVVIDNPDDSLAKKINLGLLKSTAEYLIVANDDVEHCEGSLRDLCIPEKVISPKIHGGTLKTFHAHMFCIPRNIYEEVGGFDESCPGVYHIDSDYWLRLIDLGYPPELSDTVTIYHNHPASTIKTLPQKERDVNLSRQWFIEKHGVDRMHEVGA